MSLIINTQQRNYINIKKIVVQQYQLHKIWLHINILNIKFIIKQTFMYFNYQQKPFQLNFYIIYQKKQKIKIKNIFKKKFKISTFIKQLYKNRNSQMQSAQIKKQQQHSYTDILMNEFVGGTVGGALSVIAGHPLDTIRVRMQEQKNSEKLSIRVHAINAIQKEGFLSLFRGMLSPLTGIPILLAINFASFGTLKKMVGVQQLNGPKDYVGVSKMFFCGGLTGFLQAFICSPIELCKVVMQADTTSNTVNGQRIQVNQQNGGSWSVAKYIYSNYGIQGISRGLCATIGKDIMGYGMFFTSHQYLKCLFQHHLEENNINIVKNTDQLASCIAGGFAGMLAWMTVYPSDVIKTRYQMDYNGKKYNSFIDCFKKSVKNEGNYKFLYNGFEATLIRAFPMNVIRFYGYDMAIKQFNKIKKQH